MKNQPERIFGMRVLFFIFSLSAVLSVSAKEMELKSAVDSNGCRYNYVTNDPYNGREYTLPNGLKVYLSKIPVKPRITFKLAVRGGMADSPADVTGLAHYFEHMMFKGTSRIGALDYEKEKKLLDQIEKLFEERRKTTDPAKKDELYARIDKLSGEAAKLASAGEYSRLIASIGGMGLNAFTASDMTVYMVDIPSQELEKLLRLESERTQDPVMRLFHTELETVYEEFNRGQDNDSRVLFEELCVQLFPTHPYGWTPFIGKPEHLKNPSIARIKEFFRQYYVPGNMAILLAGDLDFDKTIRLVARYFGPLQGGNTPPRMLPKEKPLEANATVRISGPQAEQVLIGYRVEPGRKNELLGTLLAEILSNGAAGLMDRDLIRAQKVLSAEASFYDRRDYSMLLLSGRPKLGQSHDEVAALLLGEIDKVKKGEFEDWLLKAVIANYRKNLVRAREKPDNATWTYLDSFVKGTSYVENLRTIDALAKIRKEDVAAFAKSLGNYVRADKLTGKPGNRIKVDKPPITPIVLNADKISPYAKDFTALPPSPLPKLDVIDFKKDFTLRDNGTTKLFYSNKPSPANDTLFTFQLLVEAGRDHDPLLPLAIDYLNYLGTDRFSASELRNEFYKLALGFSIGCSNERTSVNLDGFGDKMTDGLELVKHFLSNVKPDENAWNGYLNRVLKARADAKKNPSSVFQALNNYVAYGADPENNPVLYANSISEEQLRKLKAADLVELAKKYLGQGFTPKLYAYAGPASIDKVNETVQQALGTNPILASAKNFIPPKHEFKQLPTEQPRVFLIPYDSAQLMIGLRTRASLFDLVNTPKIMLFNQYFGAGGLDNVVFQEIRESRSLAYNAYAYYSDAFEKGKYDVFIGFIGTQPDKFFEATEAMRTIFHEVPIYPQKIELAKQQVMKGMCAEKRYGNLVGAWLNAQKIGIDYDWRADAFRELSTLTAKDVEEFAKKEISSRKYDLFILGPIEKIDRGKLEKYGPVTELKTEQVFGY